MAEQRKSCCEPSGAGVGTLRDALRLFGIEITAGQARVALTAALMAEHERRDQAEPSGDVGDPRRQAYKPLPFDENAAGEGIWR